jgi:hypothetical protein
MSMVFDDVNSDIEETIERGMEQEEVEDVAEITASKKDVKRRAPKKVAVTKGSIEKVKKVKESKPRPAPRPHKKMCSSKLTTTIQELQHRQEEIETKLRVNNIRLRKLLAEEAMRQN